MPSKVSKWIWNGLLVRVEGIVRGIEGLYENYILHKGKRTSFRLEQNIIVSVIN